MMVTGLADLNCWYSFIFSWCTDAIDSSEISSDLLTAGFFRLREGNDNPHGMDYHGCRHPAIRYSLCPREGIGSTFPENIIGPIDIGLDGTSIFGLIES